MKTLLLIAFTVSVVAQETNLPSLTIGTNTYHHVTLRKRNAAEAILKFDGGLTMVKIADLPEPLRSAWADPDANQFVSNRVAQAKAGEQRIRFLEEEKRLAGIRLTHVEIDGRLTPKSSLKTIDGQVVSAFPDGLLIVGETNHFKPIRLTAWQRAGAATRIPASFFAPQSLAPGKYAFVRNARQMATGDSFYGAAMDMKQVVKRGSVMAALFDCGTSPKLTNSVPLPTATDP